MLTDHLKEIVIFNSLSLIVKLERKLSGIHQLTFWDRFLKMNTECNYVMVHQQILGSFMTHTLALICSLRRTMQLLRKQPKKLFLKLKLLTDLFLPKKNPFVYLDLTHSKFNSFQVKSQMEEESLHIDVEISLICALDLISHPPRSSRHSKS